MIAGLPGNNAWVCVGPPLSASGPSSGSIGSALVPIWFPFVPLVRPEIIPVPSPTKLFAPDTEPKMSLSDADSFPATIELLSDRVPEMKMPPPLFPLIVLLVTLAEPRNV